MAERRGPAARRIGRLRAFEFALLYVGLPLGMALALPADWLWLVLFAATALALGLLAATPGFAWAELARGWRRIDWRQVGAMAVATAAVAGAARLVRWCRAQAFALPRRATGLWLAIMALYPLLSAAAAGAPVPGAVLPPLRRAVPEPGGGGGGERLRLRAGAPDVLELGGAGADLRRRRDLRQAYLGRGGFALAVVLHAVAGAILFTSGLGGFFYHGAIGR